MKVSFASAAGRRRAPTTCLVAGVLLWGTFGIVRSQLRAGDGLTAQYYANANWQGRPALSVVDPEPSAAQMGRRWGATPPDVFSAVWTGYLAVGQSGSYDFLTSSDDRSRLYVDGDLIVDDSGPHSSLTRSGRVRLTRGAHRIRLDFVRLGDGYALDWSWARDGGPFTPVPSWALSRRAAGYRTVLAARVLGRSQPMAALLALAGAAWLVLTTLAEWRPAWRRLLTSVAVLPGRVLPRLAGTGKRAVVLAAYGLPVFFILHAIVFWGRGIVDQEATSFIVNYLADRPFVAAIFDPRLNDWGLYQARELSYVFDFVDARVFAALLDKHTLVFVPLSGALGLVAAASVYIYGARRVLRVDGVTVGLLLSLFLSCIVTQASTGIFYRSSKIVLSVTLLAFLFQLTALLRQEDTPARSWRKLLGLFLLGLAMSMSDRQGFFFLLVATGILAMLWVREAAPSRAPGHARGNMTLRLVLATNGAAVVVAQFYNMALAPWVILQVNGYWPDGSYQEVPFVRLNWALVKRAFEMFGAQVSYFFGNAPLPVIGAFAVLLGLVFSRNNRSRSGDRRILNVLTGDTFLVSAASLAALVVLLGLMIMRHPPVGVIPDHAFWYYTLSMHAAFLFGVTLVASRLRGSTGVRGQSLVHLGLLALIAGNVAHYAGQRQIMINSGAWFGKQYAYAAWYVHDFDVMEGRNRSSERSLPSWIQMGSTGIIVEWPLDATGFLDNVRTAYATLADRPPFGDAGGPNWEALRGFLIGEASLLSDAGQARSLVDGLRSIGVRRLVVRRDRYDRADEARATAKALLGARKPGDTTSDDGKLLAIDLASPAVRRREERLRLVPPGTFRVTKSSALDVAQMTANGDATPGGTGEAGSEWVRVDFDSPRALGRIRTNITAETLADYPRRFVVESLDGARIRTVYDASLLGPMMSGLLRPLLPAPLEIDLEPNRSRTLLLREIGRTQPWNWSLHELTFYEVGKEQLNPRNSPRGGRGGMWNILR